MASIDKTLREARMADRTDKVSDTILAALPPIFAITWVIADAATGMAPADWSVRVNLPTVQIISEAEAATAPTLDTAQNRTPVVVCSHNGAVAADSKAHKVSGTPQSPLLRLCQAGLKFTLALPKF
jgi:hypothetical protein